MSQFTTPLDVRFVDGKHWVVLSPFVYDVGGVGSGETISVPTGFITDFASIPRIVWPVIGQPAGQYGKAAVIHDFLYQDPGGRSRRRCDQIFLEGMQVLGVSWPKRTTMYFAVRVGGRKGWVRYRKKEWARAVAEACKGLYRESE